MTRRLLAALLALLICAPAAARAPADPRIARTDALLATLAGANEPGLVVGVWHGGKVVYRGARGLADLEQRTPLTPRSVFHLASISKQFTGYAVLSLAAQGKIDLDADVHRYLPELPDFGATVRIRHLLTMTSGLKDQWALLRLSGRDWQDVMTQAMLLDVVARAPALDYPPGGGYAYCNTGYLLLSEIVARVTGQPFAAAMAATVFRPFGLANTFVYDDVHRPVPGRVNSYFHLADNAPWRRQALLYENWGPTSVHSTLDDMLRWGVAWPRATLNGRPLFRALSQRSQLTDGRPNTYGAGLYGGGALGEETVEHGGADASFRHIIRYFPAEDVGVVVLTNDEGDPGAIANRVARLWLAHAAAPPPAALRDAAPVPRDAAGVYAGGRTDAALALTESATGLLAWVGDEAGIPLRVAARDQLTGADGAFGIRVLRGAGGAVTGIDITDSHNPWSPYVTHARRLSPPAKIDTDAYVGEYRSAALGITCRVRWQDGRLVVAPAASPIAVKLEPTDPDRFEGWDYAFRTLKFAREGGRVVAFTVTADRATNIRFDRLPPVRP